MSFHLNLRSDLVSSSAEQQNGSHTWLYVPLAVLFVFQLCRRACRWSSGGRGCWASGCVWRLCRSRVHLRILGGGYIKALQGGAPSVTGEGTAPPFLLATGIFARSCPSRPRRCCPLTGRKCQWGHPHFASSHRQSDGSGSLWWNVLYLSVPRKRESIMTVIFSECIIFPLKYHVHYTGSVWWSERFER